MTAFPANLPGLTSVRFVLALGVVFFHYQLQWPWDAMSSTGLLDRARLGVDVFFILSGFVLTHAYREAIESGRLNYRRFIVARVARIYPAHVAVLLFALVMVGSAILVGADFDTGLYDPAGLLPTFLLIHAWYPEEFAAKWNGPSWSLSAEWFAYLVFPVFAWVGLVLRRRPWLLLLLSALIFVVIDRFYQVVFGDVVVHAQNRLGILRIIPEFLFGIALYRLGETLQPTRAVAIAIAISCAALLLGLMHFKADDRIVVVAAGPFVLALALLSKADADAGIAKPWMLESGEASYALYLVHMPILIGWKGVHSLLTNRPSTYTFEWWEIGVLLALTLVAAFALHYLVEGPARRWIRRRADAAWPDRGADATMKPGSQPPDI